MTKIALKIRQAVVAASMLLVLPVNDAFAHPGHGLPDLPGFGTDCGNCGGTAGRSRSNADRSDGEGSTTLSDRFQEDVKSLVAKTQTTQAKIAKAGGRVSKTYELFKQTGEVTAAARRQVLRSLRSARRTNQRLARDLSLFIDQYSDNLASETRTQLETDLVALNSNTDYLSAQEAKLSDVRSCASRQCSDVIEMLDQQGDWTGEITNVTALTQTLTTLSAGENL